MPVRGLLDCHDGGQPLPSVVIATILLPTGFLRAVLR
jgi:hypothetical protein